MVHHKWTEDLMRVVCVHTSIVHMHVRINGDTQFKQMYSFTCFRL